MHIVVLVALILFLLALDFFLQTRREDRHQVVSLTCQLGCHPEISPSYAAKLEKKGGKKVGALDQNPLKKNDKKTEKKNRGNNKTTQKQTKGIYN